MGADDKKEEGGFYYFDGQWDVIRHQTAEQFKEALNNHKSKSPRLLSLGYRSTGKFRPVLDDVSNDTSEQIELFENNSNYVCHLRGRAVDVVAESLLNLKNRLTDGLQPAGYTYLAQLLTHDIVSSTSLLKTRNASSTLNLDSIYFDYDQVLNWRGVDSDGKFIMSGDGTDFCRADWAADTLRAEGFEIPPFRTEAYHFAVIPDHRNDGNVILSQLHVLLQKLHNEIVELLAQEIIKHRGDRQRIYGREYYEKARDIVVLLFQQVTVSDLLKRTLDQDTFEYYFSHQGPSLFPKLKLTGGVPKEFSHAVSRYAHSMIRSHYFLNDSSGHDVGVEKLFKKNTPLKNDKENLIISDWRRFFSMPWQAPDVNVNKANKIQLSASRLSISSGPQELRSNPARNLATFDITASSQLCTFSKVMENKNIEGFLRDVKGLVYPKSGYFDKIDYSGVNEELRALKADITLDNTNAPFLVSMHLESSAMPQKHNEDRLGVVGSIIYAETIRLSIESAELNIMQDEIDLRNILKWAYPVYQSALSSLGSINMIGLSTFKTLIKRG